VSEYFLPQDFKRRFKIFTSGVFTPEASPGYAQVGENPITLFTGNISIGNYTYAPYAEPKFMSVTSDGEMGELRATFAQHTEDFSDCTQVGQGIQVYDLGYNAGNGSGNLPTGNGDLIFDGMIYKSHIVFNGQEEMMEVVCYNNGDDILRRAKIHGQLRLSYASELSYFTAGPQSYSVLLQPEDNNIITIDTPCIFNKDGQPNMLNQSYYGNFTQGNNTGTNTFNVFDAPFRTQVNNSNIEINAQYWTIKDAIKYLINTQTPIGWSIATDSCPDSYLDTVFVDNPQISNINIEGDSIAEALNKILNPHNYGFWVDSISDYSGNNSSAVGKHNIYFFSRANNTDPVVLYMSARGNNAYPNYSNLIHCDFTIDATAVVNQINSFGDRIDFTTLASTIPTSTGNSTAMLLSKTWNNIPSGFNLSDFAVGGIINYGNTSFIKNYKNPELISPDIIDNNSKPTYGVGRYWSVNQGQIGGVTIGNMSLLLKDPDFIGEHNSTDLRQFEKPEWYKRNYLGAEGEQYDVVVEMSIDSGGVWNHIDSEEYKIVNDKISGMGIIFTSPNLDELGYLFKTASGTGQKSYWQAQLDNTLQIRLIAKVKSDQRVSYSTNNENASFPLANTKIYNNDGYHKNNYNDVTNGTLEYVNYTPLGQGQSGNSSPIGSTVDQTPDLGNLTTLEQVYTDRLMTYGRAQVLLKEFDQYTPGQSITQITNRITFAFPPTIIKCIYKFEDQQIEIIVDNHRFPALLDNKAITEARTARQKALGISENEFLLSSNVPGGQATPVPYLTGDINSMEQYYERGGP